ncbi:hypothetical protein SAMN05660909_01889 [Chitinophaga terrae (ex Kim and Jung 2007)]|uniref:Uncharacterized protein n=1 Tax=Chitinophaga terrae (ex Kim and Jung 2007) TaxID=408074 RepID=A0A1H4B527_9BACT|nr:hypothetical protein [Chitinophaga terrae (ex Kim and Jung 2007)]MDQ0106375.1 hypothetical protein [Chitinophaga terrae (ex Kim and Jung 2007)]GEP91161.1 hypothetical protein CTE07_28060 [Chitinophaga terrae (ex Kim and Jung 2007)]SEA43263.1 hypothetical protein SAMN05660909_01889 [Chitinophaga terrae (ex Kim and Jung 2007)]
MDYKLISGLVEKYWEGETSLEEEAILREFFSTPHTALPPDLEEAAPLFSYLHTEAVREVVWPGEETKVVKLSPVQHWMKYAAMLLMALGLGYGLQHRGERAEITETRITAQHMEDDPRYALEETKKALRLLAKNLNKGTTQMQKLSYFNDATEVIEGK